jgi:hypothetical protein
MEVGFIVDKGDYNVSAQGEWVAGAPEPSFWGGMKLKGRDKYPVLTYRCPRCGRLQSYAASPND